MWGEPRIERRGRTTRVPALVAAGIVALAVAPAADAATQTFSHTGAVQTWTVPIGVTQATFTLYGGQGAPTQLPPGGGLGGRTIGTLAVTPGQVIELRVGGRGNVCATAGCFAPGGYNGGGSASAGPTGGPSFPTNSGAGASDVRVCATPGTCPLSNRVLVAGGGGGVGRGCGTAGIGGGTTGGDGAVGISSCLASFGGHGGTQTAGGAGGSAGSPPDAQAGDQTRGGDASSQAGGGGGGYWGGGAGDFIPSQTVAIGGSGGGGSGFCGVAATGCTTTAQSVRLGHGEITISYTPPPLADLALTMSDSDDPVEVGDTVIYTARIDNLGPNARTGVTLLAGQIGGLAYDDTNSDARCFEADPETIQCDIGTIASSGFEEIAIAVTTTASANPAVLFGSVVGSSDQVDPNASNNSASENTLVLYPASIYVVGSTLTYTPGNGDQVNQPTISFDGGEIVVEDGGAGLQAASAACTPTAPRVVVCDPATIDSYDVTLGSGTGAVERLTVESLPPGLTTGIAVGGPGREVIIGGAADEKIQGEGGRDTLIGGPGFDRIVGGHGVDSLFGRSGNDVLRADEGEADAALDCGPGNDRLLFDAGLDPPAIGCEH